MSMPRWTLVLGSFLALLGVGLYFGTGRASVTALIPTFLGIPLIACALWARRDSMRAAAMHVAAVLALIGFGGTVSGVIKTARLVGGQAVERPEAAVGQALVAFACLTYLIVAIRSFARARRVRLASSAG